MTTAADVLRAREDARRARTRLADDAALLGRRAHPSALAADAGRRMRKTVLLKPLWVAGAVGTLALLAALPPTRHAAGAVARAAWRNRGVAKLFIR